MSLIVNYGGIVFITLEVLSLLCLLLFGLTRYWFNRKALSTLFIFLFIFITVLEAVLAWLLYRETGEISSLQIIITIFVLYAVTFGYQDFRKLDRWMKKKIGQWRGVNLLTADDHRAVEKQKDPVYKAKHYRHTAFIHIGIFLSAQVIFFSLGTESIVEAFSYLQDWSWLNGETPIQSTPYPNETIYSISMIWGIVFVVDMIYSWSYTFFPQKTETF
ncbi:hypothetical protein EH196_04260 [Bacillus sp. C1-1]|nr:hypothetical protein EH196_04260 [Bacillus sp. C1-1]